MIFAVLCIAAAWLALVLYAQPQRVSPDGRAYLTAAAGAPVPVPFHLRRLLPRLLGQRLVAWRAASGVGLVVAAGFVAHFALAQGLEPNHALLASVLFIGLPIFNTTATLPVLVDGPALALTFAAATLAVSGHVLPAVLVACVGAAVKEHVPLFAAAASLCPWLLVALVVPLVLRVTGTVAPPDHDNLRHPFAYARVKQSPRVLSAAATVLPWGVCLAALLAPTPAMWLSLALAYGLTFVAADSTRIYQWAALPVCVQAASVVPSEWLVPAAVAHLWWPWKGEL